MRGLVATALVLAACGKAPHATPATYELPTGFTGWVMVEYGVPGAPALPLDHGARILRIPADGTLRTSSAQEFGIVHNQFFFVDAAAKRTPIAEPENTPSAVPGEAQKAHAQVVVLGFSTGSTTFGSEHHVYEQYYVGLGPAGAAPDWKH